MVFLCFMVEILNTAISPPICNLMVKSMPIVVVNCFESGTEKKLKMKGVGAGGSHNYFGKERGRGEGRKLEAIHHHKGFIFPFVVGSLSIDFFATFSSFVNFSKTY